MIVRLNGVDLWCCDFCGKRRSLVRVLISAPTLNVACICDECVEVAAGIVEEQTGEGRSE